METLEEQLKRLMTDISQARKDNSTSWTKTYQCDKCKDTGFIVNDESNSAKRCSCQEAKDYQERLKNSGIAEEFLKKTFDGFEIRNEELKIIVADCKSYVELFLESEKERKNSLGLVGKVGSGKTHLGMAVANELMKIGVGVLYVSYPSMIQELKQCSMDKEEFDRLIFRYQNARVLFIDDFMKVTKNFETDLNYLYQIVNFRYLNKKPLIITSELRPAKWSEYDEALGTRLYEMAKVIKIFSHSENYRTKGVK